MDRVRVCIRVSSILNRICDVEKKYTQFPVQYGLRILRDDYNNLLPAFIRDTRVHQNRAGIRSRRVQIPLGIDREGPLECGFFDGATRRMNRRKTRRILGRLAGRQPNVGRNNNI